MCSKNLPLNRHKRHEYIKLNLTQTIANYFCATASGLSKVNPQLSKIQEQFVSLYVRSLYFLLPPLKAGFYFNIQPSLPTWSPHLLCPVIPEVFIKNTPVPNPLISMRSQRLPSVPCLPVPPSSAEPHYSWCLSGLHLYRRHLGPLAPLLI